MREITENILPHVSKPARYIGNELNSIHKNHENKIKIALCYPDAYEIGMSNLGLSILYNVLNSQEDIAAERVYSPWPDMEEQLRKYDLPLFSLESRTKIRAFDILGFSIQNELTYTNLLNILDLSKIPLFRSQRNDSHPLVIAGGASVSNPMPLIDFIDAFVIGDGEEVILEIAKKTKDQRLKTKGLTPNPPAGAGQASPIGEGQGRGYNARNSLLDELAKIEGVFVPGKNEFLSVKRRIVKDLNTIDYPTKPIVPYIEIVHDRAAIEIMRGCPRRCRFCQASSINKPVRLLKPENIVNLAKEIIKNTGFEELSLLSLSSSDYPWILDVAEELEKEFAPKKISLSLPSLRADTLNKGIAKKLQSVRKSGVTIAPEAGSQRLRDHICKDLSEDDILLAAENAFIGGAKSIKLYFMIGLPTETDEDLFEIINLSNKMLFHGRQFNKRAKIVVNISTFVPKKGTELENEIMISLTEIIRKQNILKNNIKNRNIELRWHNPHMSRLEGLFSSGGPEIGKVLYEAYLKGCRFDNWVESFDFKKWEEVLVSHKIKI